ncbi:hypothetical protein BVX99_00430 [bacterium F16]|nr:hypothetical protein BVX99_00430 [bacterium F16]
MSRTKVLVIDDDALMLEMCQDILHALHFESVIVQDSTSVMGIIASEHPDLVISDLMMPKVGGMEILRDVKEAYPTMPVIILTGQGTLESAFKAVQLGADDYVTKPFQADELGIRIRQALKKSELAQENLDLKRQLQKSQRSADIIGKSKAMQKVHALIERAAPTKANVMIIGESGTGKEMVARAIHKLSERADNPFVPVDCVSLPDQLFESELFGHVKGAFTGAADDKEGLLETANGGTLFLDEITEMNYELQGKLLRVLQERKFRRVGGRELHDLDIRLIAATNRIPLDAVEQERLRLDLYYRLNVIPMNLPPLSERKGDLIELLRHFITQFSDTNGQRVQNIDRQALDALTRYSWPGNIRELQNLAERLVILSSGDTIEFSDLPPEVQEVAQSPVAVDSGTSSGSDSTKLIPAGSHFPNWALGLDEMIVKPLLEAKREFVEIYIQELLKRHKGKITTAAKASGINRRTIHRVLSEAEIDPNSFRDRN